MKDFKPLDVLRAVRDLRGMSAVEKAVLYGLVLRADAHGRCWPSYATIADDAGVSLRTAKVAVFALYEAGHLLVVRRAVEGKRENDSNLYTVKVVQQLHDVVQEDHHLVQGVHDGGAGGSPRVVQQLHEGGAAAAPKLPIELPMGTAQGSVPLSLTLARPDAGSPKGPSQKAQRRATHTADEIAAKAEVLAHFVERFEAVKGCKPKSIDAGDNAAAFKLAKTYGSEEACSIIDRAFGDAFVVEKAASLKYIASKGDTFRGKVAVAGASRRERNPVQASAGFAAQLTAATANGVQPLVGDDHKRWGRKAIGEGGET